jgi:hypothetical protein
MFKIFVVAPRYDERDGICGSNRSFQEATLTEAGAVVAMNRLGRDLPEDYWLECYNAEGKQVHPVHPETRRRLEAERAAYLEAAKNPELIPF